MAVRGADFGSRQKRQTALARQRPQFVVAIDVIMVGDHDRQRHIEALMAKIALLEQGPGPGGDPLRLDQSV